jgi:7-keto-8-aminopelargonate synthetase-like enzyme
MRQTSPTTVNVQGRELRLFGGTGYLGLSFEPKVIDALVLAARTFGLGIGTSPKTTGYSPELEQLESALAGFLRQQSVLVTGSGTLANIAAIEGLSDDIDHWICDQDSHSSFSRLVSLSGKRPIYYRHLDYEHLRQVMDAVQGSAAVFTDAVFPLTGEVADIDEVAKATAAPGSLLIVDESHSVGVVGPHGRGLAEHLGLASDRLIVTSTLSKGLGSVGGAIGGSARLVDKIRRCATSYAGSAALPPALCSAASAAVQIVAEDGARLERLHDNCGVAAQSLPAEISAWHGSDIPIPIFAIAASSHSDLAKLHEHCVDAGYFIPLIRGYPGAPEAGLLRMSVTSEHHPAEVAEVCGLIRSRIGLD